MKCIPLSLKKQLSLIIVIYSFLVIITYLINEYANFQLRENLAHFKIQFNDNYQTVHNTGAKYNKSWTTYETSVKVKERVFYGIDGHRNFNRFKRTEKIECEQNLRVEIIVDRLERADFTFFNNKVKERRDLGLKWTGKRHYYMVYAMESEPHSEGGETWPNADFYMWYNLDLSFPEPATYFDVRSYLIDLLDKPRVEFEHKNADVSIVWIISNCNAFNGRQKFVHKLMQHIRVDSYGDCFKNKKTRTNQRMYGNVELYAKYKFVIAIENSNCDDYVTEKLVHAVASGSVPIVAGLGNKPDYLKFMPSRSFINVYDFKSIKSLVEHIKNVSSSKYEYEKYIHFKGKHQYTREHLKKLPLPDLIQVAERILDREKEKAFFNGLLLKEKSENKFCKLARYLARTPQNVIEQEIRRHSRKRPNASEACLPPDNLSKFT